MHGRLSILLAACAVALGALAAPAVASKRATKAQTRAVAHAIDTSPVGGIGKLPKSWYRVVNVRISSLSSNWAYAAEAATKAGEGKFQPGYVIAVKPAGGTSWTVVDVGTAMVGCGIAPNAVIADLLKIKASQACPSGEGIRGS